jgi:meso-butanediol dehydrogenase/(S,S)-butanediol dehydrogenase/diacetyl reductase
VTGRLEAKVALITGTAGGQGRAAALLFAAEGAAVAGSDVNAAGAAETVELVRAAGGHMDSTHPLNPADEDGVAAWADAAAERHGGVDIVYNNAGATRFAPITGTTFADWSFTIRNELDIVFLVTTHAWPHLGARGGGSIVLIGSTAGLTGSMTNMRIAHTASKGGVIAMTRQLAAEGARHGIRANCVSPGMIRTPLATAPCSLPITRCAPSPGTFRSAGSANPRRSRAVRCSWPATRLLTSAEPISS